MIEFAVVGLPELLEEIDAVEAGVVERTPEALRAAGELIREAWVENIESEGLVLTGHYRDSVTVTVEGNEARVHSDVPYGPILEHGDSRQEAHPVAERALDEKQDDAIAAAGKVLGEHF